MNANLKRLIKRLIPDRLDRWRKYHYVFKIGKQQKTYRNRIKDIRKKSRANVVFIASSMGMWRCDNIALKLGEDDRFNVLVAICSFITMSPEEKELEINILASHFEGMALNYAICREDGGFALLKERFAPDVIFYPQPYSGIVVGTGDWSFNNDCLLAYVPYGLLMCQYEFTLHNEFLNSAWRHYLQYEPLREELGKVALNRAENVVVVGEVRGDELREAVKNDPWKVVDKKQPIRKRIIWAPHFRMDRCGSLYRPDFEWMAEGMLELAREYEDDIQIAFKPHPVLRSALYKHPAWGKEKTDSYYEQWAAMPNTQLETGEYIDLFKTSDAIIHNCGSFTGEYLFVDKPCAFVTRDEAGIRRPFKEFGNRCLDCYEIVSDMAQIRRFIEDVVIKGIDSKKSVRKDVLETVLGRVNGRSVAENIYEDMTRSLFGE